MIPILLGSVVAMALALERLWFFWKIRLDTEAFSERVFSLIRSQEARAAVEMCANSSHPLAAIFRAGLEHADEESSEVERVMEREGNRQLQKLEKNLNVLVMVIGVEPLLGFLGTIIGLIQAFMTWERFSTSVTVSTLAGGIYQAMITTAAGLIIAIPYFVVYHFFIGKVSAISHELNHYGDELVSILRKANSKTVLG